MPNSSEAPDLKPIEVVDSSPKLSSRRKRVRSLIRKRGGRGSGRNKLAQKANGVPAESKTDEGSNPSPAQPTPQQPKRARIRKNRNWKPYSQQTWEERLEREHAEERKALEKSQRITGVHSSSSKRSKRKRSNDIEIPKAPRNTTQNLFHTNDYYGEEFDMNQRQMPSLQGLLSRETIRLKFLRDENSRATSDDENPVSGANGEARGEDDNGPQMNSPAYSSVGSVGSPCADLSPEHHSVAALSVSGMSRDLERDEMVQRLTEENRRLRCRVETLERELAERDRQPRT